MASNPAVLKPKGAFDVEYQSKDGSWKTATVKKPFVVPSLVSEIEVPVIEADGETTRKVKRNFKRKLVETVEDAIKLLNDPTTRFITLAGINYSFDLFARGAIKAPIASEEEGPGKVIAKLADQIMASFAKRGKKLSAERALKMAVEMHEAEMEAEDSDEETETAEAEEEVSTE